MKGQALFTTRSSTWCPLRNSAQVDGSENDFCKMLNLSARGFCVEWMAAVTVLVCGISKEFAIPVSTTHCQVSGLVARFIGERKVL